MRWRAVQAEVSILTPNKEAGAKTAIRAGSPSLLFTLTTIYTLAALYYAHWTLEYSRSAVGAPGSDGWS